MRLYRFAVWLTALLLMMTGCAASTPHVQPLTPPVTPPVVTAPGGSAPPAPEAPAPGGWVDAVRSIQMVRDSAGWAFTPGTAYRTTDGGAHWVAARYRDGTSTTTYLLKAFALDRDHAWVAEWQDASKFLTLWATTNGGQTWSSTQVEVATRSAGRVDLGFLNPSDGWLLLSSGPALGLMYKAVFRTHDGGRTWDLLTCGCPDHAEVARWLVGGMYTTGMAFRDDRHGWITGIYHGGDLIPVYSTTDRGKSWKVQELTLPPDLPKANYGNALQPIFFGTTGQAGVLPISLRIQDGYDVLPFVTQDGGRTWVPGGALPSSQCGDDYTCQVAAVDTAHIWILQKKGSLYRTQDGGKTWRTFTSQPGLVQVTFGTAAQGLGLVQDGPHQTLVASNDGGQTWAPLAATLAAAKPLGNLVALYASSRWGWGIAQGQDRQPQVATSSDDGAHWRQVTPATLHTLPDGSFFLDDQHAWLVQSSAQGETSDVLHTDDAGTHWTTASIPVTAVSGASVYFLNDHTGWILVHRVGMNHDQPDIFHTWDGGTTWMRLSPGGSGDPYVAYMPSLGGKSGIVFVDPSIGFVGSGPRRQGVGGLYKTTDGGRTWEWQSLRLPAAAEAAYISVGTPVFVGAQVGLLPVSWQTATGVGFDLFMSGDGGQSWHGTTPVTIPEFASMRTVVVDAAHAWAWSVTAGGKSLLYRTADGGQSWQPLAPPAGTLQFMTFRSALEGWAIVSPAADTVGSQLLVTHDGGATWETVSLGA